MLRYYDKMGLIVPAKIGPDNGYRYYEANQLSQILRIERYKGYGFRLSEIGELLELEGPALREALTHQREALLEEQAALGRLQVISRKMSPARRNAATDCGNHRLICMKPWVTPGTRSKTSPRPSACSRAARRWLSLQSGSISAAFR